jgi:predicted lipoprotein with Yx(FWY)xxD motif
MNAPQRLHAPHLLALGAAGMLVLAACGSSGSGSASTGGSSSSSQTSATGASNAAITVAAASVPGIGTALVNGNGLTLYMLTSEKGGTLTCTDDNGCTKVWPDTELPSGTTRPIAGSGIDASKLSTIKAASGNLYITYAGWPLYTYSGDTGPGQAKGLGIVSFGGTWYPLSPAGAEITSGSGASGSGTTTSSSYGSGY